MTIVVTGGSGFIGTELTRALLAKGYTVIIIDKRGPQLTHQNLFYIPCDLEKNTLPFNVLERTDAVINLAGELIAKKWTKKRKEEIRASRVDSTKHLIESLAQTANKPPIFISASTTCFYGDSGNGVLDERAVKGETFLSDVAAAWEHEAMKAEEFGSRVVVVRTAPVLGKKGILAFWWRLAKLHLTMSISKRDFWMPWIHINDIVRVYVFALETGTLQGIVNAVAPTPTKYRNLFIAFKKITRSISFGRVPLLTALFGDYVHEMTVSRNVVPQRLIDKGFEFLFDDPIRALRALKYEKN